MTPAGVKSMYERMMAQEGEYVTIRRYTGSGLNRPWFEAQARARVTNYQENELVGTIQQGDRNVILYADDLLEFQFPMPVTANDKLILRGRELSIVSVDDSTRRVKGELIALEIQIRG